MIPQIGRVLNLGGMGVAESSRPYPRAQKDRKHVRLDDGRVVDRKTQRQVYKWGDGTTVQTHT